jgi:hypothetical protein
MILGDARFGFPCCSCTRDNDSKLLSCIGSARFERRVSESPQYRRAAISLLQRKMRAPVPGHINAAAESDSVNALHVLEQLDQSAGAAVLADVVQADRQ